MRFFAWIRCKTEYRSVALLGGIWAISCLPLLSGSHITLFHILKEIEDFQGQGVEPIDATGGKSSALLGIVGRRRPNCASQGSCSCFSRVLRKWFCCDCLSGPCFPGSSTVQLESGDLIPMAHLSIGSRVLAGRDEGGEDKYSRVVMFFDRRPKEIAEYFSFTTLTNHTIHISASHLIYTKEGSHDPLATKYAWEVEEKEYLSVKEVDGNRRWKESPVVLIGSHLQQGAYVPITEDGSIVVDGILASCYASFPHRLSHLASIPARWIPEAWIPFYVQTLKALGNLMSWDQTPGMKMGAIRRVPTGRRILDSIHSPSLRFLLLSLTTL